MAGRLRSRLDPWLFRGPFEGARARRYATRQRSGFGDLDERLLEIIEEDLAGARTFLDLGAGPGTFAERLAASRSEIEVIALEPSAAYAGAAQAPVRSVRARAEAIPLAAGSIDVALCLGSIRHVKSRGAALSELRRVVAARGAAWIVELDPAAGRSRIACHARGMRSRLFRAAFGPILVKTAPRWQRIADLARAQGWATVDHVTDQVQPVYLLRLSGSTG